MKNILLYIWQLPQNICGVVYKLFCRPSYKQNIDGVRVYETNSKQGSVSLGNYVFITQRSRDKVFTLKHELGHTIQSKMLGPLYLLVIGLPSVCWLLYRRQFCRHINYYWFYTEAWANKLMDMNNMTLEK